MKTAIVFAALVWATCLASCSRSSDETLRLPSGPTAEGKGTVLATVGDRHLTTADFQTEIQRRWGNSPQFAPTDSQKMAVLDEMIRFEVLLAKAKAAGYDRTPEFQIKMERFVVANYQEAQWAAQPATTAPNDADLHAYYEQHQQLFATPASVRAALIYFKSSPKAMEEKRAELKQKVTAVLTQAQARDAAGFGRLAQEFSEDQSTRYAGGDTGWLTRDTATERWPEVVVNAALAVSEIGQLAPLIETPDGFYLVRLADRKPAGVRPFNEVKEAIAYQLSQQQQQQRQLDFFEEMKRGIKIERYPDSLKSLFGPAHAAEANPPPVPRS